MTATEKIDWQTISKDSFKAYEAVRASGVTNMWNVSLVEELSDLDRDVILTIMEHYEELNKKYPDVRK